MLPSVTMAGWTTVFKSDQFARGRGAPAYLRLSILGSTETLLLVGPGGRVRAPLGDAIQDSMHEVAMRKANPKCCVSSFAAPLGLQPNLMVRVPAVAPNPPKVVIHCKPWVITASFSAATIPCQCDCCEYRQFIEGKMLATLGGIRFNISPIMDYRAAPPPPAPPPGAPAPPPLPPIPIRGLRPNRFVEDSLGDPAQPGKPLRYGRRNPGGPRRSGKYLLESYPNAWRHQPGLVVHGRPGSIGSVRAGSQGARPPLHGRARWVAMKSLGSWQLKCAIRRRRTTSAFGQWISCQ